MGNNRTNQFNEKKHETTEQKIDHKVCDHISKAKPLDIAKSLKDTANLGKWNRMQFAKSVLIATTK